MTLATQHTWCFLLFWYSVNLGWSHTHNPPIKLDRWKKWPTVYWWIWVGEPPPKKQTTCELSTNKHAIATNDISLWFVIYFSHKNNLQILDKNTFMWMKIKINIKIKLPKWKWIDKISITSPLWIKPPRSMKFEK